MLETILGEFADDKSEMGFSLRVFSFRTTDLLVVKVERKKAKL